MDKRNWLIKKIYSLPPNFQFQSPKVLPSHLISFINFIPISQKFYGTLLYAIFVARATYLSQFSPSFFSPSFFSWHFKVRYDINSFLYCHILSVSTWHVVNFSKLIKLKVLCDTSHLTSDQLNYYQAVTIGQKFLVRPAYCLSYLKIFRRSGLLPVQSYLPIGANLPIGQLAANRQSDKIGQLAEFRQLDQHFLGFFLYKKLLLET